MKRKTFLKNISAFLIKGFLLFFIALLCIFPQKTILWAKEGLTACFNSVIPSLFPFFVLSSLVIDLGLTKSIGRLLSKPLRFFFNLSGSCAVPFVLGILCGYPSGARAAGELYEKRLCGKGEAELLLSFCNNSGPAFILGAVGAGMLNNYSLGVFLYGIHILSSLLTGILFRFITNIPPSDRKMEKNNLEPLPLSEAFLSAVRRSLDNILYISALIVFFFVFGNLLSFLGVFDLFAKLLSFIPGLYLSHAGSESLARGFLEITNGVSMAATSNMKLLEKVVCLSMILGWSGICVLFQTAAVLKGKGLSLKKMVAGKFFQSILSAVLTFLFFPLFSFECENAFVPYLAASPSYQNLNLLFFLLVLILFFLPSLKLLSRRKQKKALSKKRTF